jgi:tRNA A-37 threonylcarbamoyl transferase component Bud32
MLPPITSDRFKILHKIGEGGMGEVYEALDTERNEHVAVKVLRNATAEAITRFKREFRALQDLQHPNLVTLGELVSEGDTWFFSMELVNGVDFVSWVRTAPRSTLMTESTSRTKLAEKLAAESARGGFDVPRLRAALLQVARALGALHAAQMVHRDIKPSNVLVTPEGRVVVLDFGLVAEESRASLGTTTEVAVVGTPAYMAPEQAASQPASPAADWYSVGALLYEAMTARPPFLGAPLEILLQKQRTEPPLVSTLVPQVPPDLEALCAKLLRFDPQTRAGEAEVLRALDGAAGIGPSPARSLSTAHFGVFVGRDSELATLTAAYEDTRGGGCVTVLVEGESGIGKSWLVRHFAERLARHEREPVVLTGRCFERETVPYKAFDGIIDALSRFMSRLPARETPGLLPTRPAPLAQLFPVLRRVDAIAQARQHRPDAMAPQEIRSQAFAGLREVFIRLADRRPVVLTIDDLQWADADSIALLAELLRPPEPPSLLLVATLRSRSTEPTGQSMAIPQVIAQLPGDVRHVHLGPLSTEHSRALARALIESTAPELPLDVDTIAGEAGGHPLFIDEIVRHMFLVGAPATSSLRLEEALWARVLALDTNARRLVELVSVAGSPLPQDVIAVVLDVTLGELAKLTAFLRIAHLVRTSGTRGADTIEPYHGRVRDAVTARVPVQEARALHRKVAAALESTGSHDDLAMAAHWEVAGEPEHAARHMLRAAEHASEALAFDRAANLFERSLTLRRKSASPGEREAERAIQRKWAEALGMAGRGRLAADAYMTASVGAGPAEALELRRRAAEHLLRSGHLDEGLVATRHVLAAVHLSYPESPLGTLVLLLLFRAYAALRGVGYEERDTSQISAQDITRIDVCWSVAVSLSLVDPIRGALFQERHMRLALRAGDTYRIARAAAIRVSVQGMKGASATRAIDAAVREAEDLAAKSGSAHAMAWAKSTSGIARYIIGHFKEALALTREAEQIFRNEVPGSSGEMFPVRLFTLQALAMLGRLKELATEQSKTLREAVERGDRYGAVNARIGIANLVWLVNDEPRVARARCEEALGEWSTQGFHLEHYYALMALTHVDLYEGKTKAALERIEMQWAALRRSLLLRVQYVRLTCFNLRARAALALASSTGARDESERARLLRLAERDAATIESENAAWAMPCALLVRAGVEALRGARATMLAHLERAAGLFEASDMVLHAKVTRGALGAQTGGSEGRAMVRDVEKWMRGQTIRHPAQMLLVFAPGLEVK